MPVHKCSPLFAQFLQVMYMTGWSPAENQPKPAKRGSATVSFHELAEGLERRGAVTGDSATSDATHKDR